MVISYVLGAHIVDQVWVVPTFKHRDKELTAYRHRYFMCNELAYPFQHQLVTVSQYAKEIAEERSDYEYDRTIDLVRDCHESFPGDKFRWVMGDDLLESFKTWENWEEINEKAPPIVVGRISQGTNSFQLPNISSTTVREHIDKGALDVLVPHRVARYIKTHKLYGT